MLGRADRRSAADYKHVDWEPDQLGRQVGELLCTPLCVAVLQDEILPLDVATLAQPLPEGLLIGMRLREGLASTEPTDLVHLRRWLGMSDQRRREDT